MSSKRYTLLPRTFETAGSAAPVTVEVVALPPSAAAANKAPMDNELPTYATITMTQVDVKLPSYDEVEHQKFQEEPQEAIPQTDLSQELVGGHPLGSPLAFLLTMVVTFFFGIIGYLFCYIFSCSVAARAGAIAGFGLYMVNVCMLMVEQMYEDSEAAGNATESQDRDMLLGSGHMHMDKKFAPLFYITALFGVLVFVRGFLWYLQAKRAAAQSVQLL